MGLPNYLSKEENDARSLLVSVICLFGDDGLPLYKVNEEYKKLVGKSLPYKELGYENVRAFVEAMPEIYIVTDDYNNEVLIQNSEKSRHIKNLISKQRYGPRKSVFKTVSPNDHGFPKRQRKDYLHAKDKRPYDSNTSTEKGEKFDVFEELESMLPLFYKHQALGDDFFVDIADTKMGYYVPNRPKECGLCSVGMSISKLTEKVIKAKHLAPRVVVMIGFHDLIWGSNINSMIYDLRQLVINLKRRNTLVTLLTLIPSPKMPKNPRLQARMKIFNEAILEYSYDHSLKCNVIDMNGIFEMEAQAFKRDFDRFKKVAKKDEYKVFSDYGRKIFLTALKINLREQIEAGN